ncbi:MAG: NotI family restriction endonuclease [Rhodospirillales bacterium]
MAKSKTSKNSYGIAELYGESFTAISNQQRVELLDAKPAPECPHLAGFPALAPIRKKRPVLKCKKKGGVCSIRSFVKTGDGQNFGPITATCPLRFYQDGFIFRKIGEILLGDKDALTAKEIPFLKSPQKSDGGGEEENSENVGRIDLVMASPGKDRLEWCAVELQAVYFSGNAISRDFPAVRSHSGNGVPMPGAGRHPDFRSSGPKRLMPQLQIKVPTLRRWGKKMAVVVDRPFFDALGEMDDVKDVSNSDIIWFIVSFKDEEGSARPSIALDDVRYTTLERAVEGLTAGEPTTLPDFENKIRAKLRM